MACQDCRLWGLPRIGKNYAHCGAKLKSRPYWIVRDRYPFEVPPPTRDEDAILMTHRSMGSNCEAFKPRRHRQS